MIADLNDCLNSDGECCSDDETENFEDVEIVFTPEIKNAFKSIYRNHLPNKDYGKIISYLQEKNIAAETFSKFCFKNNRDQIAEVFFDNASVLKALYCCNQQEVFFKNFIIG